MYKIYINTNCIIKKALTDLFVNSPLQSVAKNEADIIISEKKITTQKPILILQKDINLPFKLDDLIRLIAYSIEKHNNNKLIIYNNLQLSRHNLTLSYNNVNYLLTQKEFDIFVALINNDKLSTKQLLSKVWGYAESATSNTVATHINNIRRKICNDIIQIDNDNNYTVKGINNL